MAFAAKPFEPRPALALPLLHRDGWIIKPYAILGRDPAGELHDATVINALGATLPRPARTAARPGVAIAIHHVAAPLDYLVLAWWDNENELLTRVFVRDAATTGAPWQATDRESFCVWDLDILIFERDAYIRRVLAGPGDIDGYAAERFDKPRAG